MGEIKIEDLVTKVANPNVVGNPSLTANPQAVFYNVIYIFLWIIALAAVGMLIYGGFAYITAGGDAERATKGRKIIIGAIIGLILITVSLVMYNTILSVFSL